MKTRLLAIGLCLVMGLFTVSMVIAQQQDNQQRGPRGGFDPARMQQFMLDRSTTDLKLSPQEAKVIVPKIEAIIKFRADSMQELRPLQEDLGQLLNDSKPNDKAIKQQLDKIKAKAADNKKKIDAMENELKAVLTIQQEARLTMTGIITNGMGMGAMGFGGGRFGGRGGRNDGAPRQQ